MEQLQTHKGLTTHQLKLIAIVAMTCDHFAYVFVPIGPLFIILRFIGKFTFPIMCYFIAEGYFHTRNLWRYVLRLAAFAAVSHIPYVFFSNWNSADHNSTWGVLTWKPASVIFTLLCGLLALATWKRVHLLVLRLPLVAALCVLPWLAEADWPLGVPIIVAFGIFRGNRVHQGIAACCASIPTLLDIAYRIGSRATPNWLLMIPYAGTLLAIVFVLLVYNGQRGAGSKWLFYAYYPVHFLVIYAVITPILWPILYPR